MLSKSKLIPLKIFFKKREVHIGNNRTVNMIWDNKEEGCKIDSIWISLLVSRENVKIWIIYFK